MGQEFHVLRCFSCQVFQVQQVKKSKRWACKVCGEKQSLVKEFGRGGAADCRRHVQKLNALRGRLQEVTTGSQPGSDEEGESEAVDGDLDGDVMENSEEAPHPISRWSKYTDPAAEGPDEEEEEEEQNIYTEPQRSRKRRNISTVKPFSGAPDVCEDEESLTGMKRTYLQERRWRTDGNKASASCSTNLPSAPRDELNNRREEKRGRLASLGESSESRWEKFLSPPDEDEYDHALPQYDNNTLPYFTAEERTYPPDENTSGVADGSLSSISDTRTSKPLGFDPPPPCLKLSFNPMFLTDEDFDDTI